MRGRSKRGISYTFSLGTGLLVLLLLSGCMEQEARIHGVGTVEMTEVIVSGKVGGRITRFLVAEGQAVQAEELLLELDHEELDAEIVAAKASVAVAKARLAKSNSALATTLAAGGKKDADGARRAQLDVAKYNLETAKAHLEQANLDFDRAAKLFREQIISQSEYDRVSTRKRVADSQYQAALGQLELAKTAPGAEDLDLTIKQSEAQIAQAEASLNLLETKLKNTKIIAPLSGVISAKLAEVGEVVAPGAPLVTVLDNKRPWVKIYLSLLEVERIKLNQTVTVGLDAYPEVKITGRVSFIAQEAEFTPKDYQTKEERIKQVYAVKAELDNSSGLLKAGLPVEVWF